MFDGLPLFAEVIETSFGRIGRVLLPATSADIYSDRYDLLSDLVAALELSSHIGAGVVSLTGLIPSATAYGFRIAEVVSERTGLPLITTGHATTAATVVRTLERALEVSGRRLDAAHFGILGLGSIGRSTLLLVLGCLPHPAEISLCDVANKRQTIVDVESEIRRLGYKGPVHRVESQDHRVPAEFYDASLIVGATNVPAVLDVRKLMPGTIVVDDSFPLSFSPSDASARLEERGDILCAEGGLLRLPDPTHSIRFMPPVATGIRVSGVRDPNEISGCVLSGLLTSHFPDLSPTVGLLGAAECRRHYNLLRQLNICGADLQVMGRPLNATQLRRFARLWGDS